MTEEPTVLDYVKSKLKFWGTSSPAESLTIAVSAAGAAPPAQPVTPEGEMGVQLEGAVPLEVIAPPAPPSQPRPAYPFPWRTLGAFGLGLLAQLSLEPHKDWRLGLFLYGLAFLWLVMANARGEWRPALAPESEAGAQAQVTEQEFSLFRIFLLCTGVFLSLLAYMAFGGGLFNRSNVTLWALALASFVTAFWVAAPGWLERGRAGVMRWLRRPQITLTSWALLFIGVMLISVYFRAYMINEIPSQMNSDHAEKLLDVWDLEHGFPRIFFPRNTGREAFQFFLIAATDKYLHTGLSFLSMKIGAITAGLLTLPFIYLIGLEIGNRWVGMWAMAFAGIAYWPNVISRLALRFTFYPFFAAPTLYFLIRGLRRKSHNDLLLSGLLLGLGLHSYTPIRILPVVVVVGVVLYMLHHFPLRVKIKSLTLPLKIKDISLQAHIHPPSVRVQTWAISSLAVLTLIAVVGFLPLLRYIANPINREMFFFRTLTRTGSVEQPLPGNPVNIFIQNTWNAMRMFGWDNGDVWTVSIPHQPALDAVSAALCYLGMGLLFIRYVRKRNWLDLFLLLSVPMLMLPSILSLAFPNENPVPSRTAGAIIPVFVMVGIALESLLSTVRERLGPRRLGTMVAVGLGVGLFLLAANANYDLVFNLYRHNYDLSSWNSSEMGAVYHEFSTTIGTRDTFWLVGFPYWVDSRLISIVAGYADRDSAIMPDQLSATLPELRAKLFILHPMDAASLETLQQLYPQGSTQLYQSKYATKDFVMFFVPPSH